MDASGAGPPAPHGLLNCPGRRDGAGSGCRRSARFGQGLAGLGIDAAEPFEHEAQITASNVASAKGAARRSQAVSANNVRA